jgi:thiol-disulfide isomerase/thioredoxin
MKLEDKTPIAANNHRLSRLQALQIKKIKARDLIILSIVFFLGIMAAWTGQMSGYHMSPKGAFKTSKTLDELQMPRQLPDAKIIRNDGIKTTLWQVAANKRSVISFYAPWCPACQQELPLLADELSPSKQIIVIITKNQNLNEVDEQLANLGLQNINYYTDVTGQIISQGKVTKLPTTFLLRDFGKVMDRLVGYSEYQLKRIIKRAKEENGNAGS